MDVIIEEIQAMMRIKVKGVQVESKIVFTKM
jgi:hypothetical protein